MSNDQITVPEPQDDAPAQAAPATTQAQVCMICTGAARETPRIDLGTAWLVGVAMIVALLVWGARRVMREETRGAATDLETLQLQRRANEASIRAGLVVRS